MDQVEVDFVTQLIGAFIILIIARLSLLLSWPFFLWMEHKRPVQPDVPRSNYIFNWKITLWNVALSPLFSALVVVFTVTVAATIGLPSLNIGLPDINSGSAAVDMLLQGTLIFFSACLVGDLWYYWWHRAQHELPFLWELHKLHHSEEHMNATTIYRSHFLELPGQALTAYGLAVIFYILRTRRKTITGHVSSEAKARGHGYSQGTGLRSTLTPAPTTDIA